MQDNADENTINVPSHFPSEDSAYSNTGDQWIARRLIETQVLSGKAHQIELIDKILNKISATPIIDTPEKRRIALAAGFDLLMSAEYYSSVGHTGWMYCPQPYDVPLLFYPYTNTCPRCIFSHKFEFHKANKPKSGSIGSISSLLLLLYFQRLLHKAGRDVEIRKGREPVDAIVIDWATHIPTLLFAEIKAAPLVTLPLAIPSQIMISEELDAEIITKHRSTDYSALFGTDISLVLPTFIDNVWHPIVLPFGVKKDSNDQVWAYEGISRLLEMPNFLENYFAFWSNALNLYESRNTIPNPNFWLTNACGQPYPRLDNWPVRKDATGYESVSDSKTSVGMDRTDDIKKATYQVLKLGAEGKPSQKFAYKTGIVSNIHAVRHFDQYLTSLKDIVWTREPTGEITRVGDLHPNTEIFNLFDGIISLTDIVGRDPWIKSLFDF
jgi:hypothetical protein